MSAAQGAWRRPSIAERFAAKVLPEPNSGCHLWDGAHIPSMRSPKYAWPVLWVNGMHRKASRIGWELACGAIPAGMNVLHRCDNPSCVNVDHLFLGTQADNVADMDRKGRRKTAVPFGERHALAKLTEQSVIAIRSTKTSTLDAADFYGVSTTTILQIRNRQTWRHLP